jgi:hypothetical protein
LDCFLLFKTNGKAFKNPGTLLGWKSARGYSARRGDLSHVVGRPAGWATAWQPGPAKEAARGAGAGRTPDALTAWSLRGGHARGGVAHPCAPADKVSCKRWREHLEGGGNTPNEVAAARAHPSNGSTCGGRAEAAR